MADTASPPPLVVAAEAAPQSGDPAPGREETPSAVGTDMRERPEDGGCQTIVAGPPSAPDEATPNATKAEQEALAAARGSGNKRERRDVQEEKRQVLLAKGAPADIPDDPRITLLFDLNGVLFIDKKEKLMRNGMELLQQLPEERFRLGVYSSRKRVNIDSAIRAVEAYLNHMGPRDGPLFTPEIVMSREQCRPASEKHLSSANAKPWDVVKPISPSFPGDRLARVILIDDDSFKAIPGEERNMILIPSCKNIRSEDTVLEDLVEALKALGEAEDVRDHTAGISERIFARWKEQGHPREQNQVEDGAREGLEAAGPHVPGHHHQGRSDERRRGEPSHPHGPREPGGAYGKSHGRQGPHGHYKQPVYPQQSRPGPGQPYGGGATEFHPGQQRMHQNFPPGLPGNPGQGGWHQQHQQPGRRLPHQQYQQGQPPPNHQEYYHSQPGNYHHNGVNHHQQMRPNAFDGNVFSPHSPQRLPSGSYDSPPPGFHQQQRHPGGPWGSTRPPFRGPSGGPGNWDLDGPPPGFPMQPNDTWDGPPPGFPMQRNNNIYTNMYPPPAFAQNQPVGWDGPPPGFHDPQHAHYGEVPRYQPSQAGGWNGPGPAHMQHHNRLQR